MRRWRCGALLVALLLPALPAARAEVSPVGPEFPVNTYTTGPQTRPAVGGDTAGSFVVVWQSGSYYGLPSQDGSGDGVFSQRHASSGQRLGGETQVNTFTAGPQASPAVAVAPSGEFVVVWTSGVTYGSPDQDGSAAGAFVQRFDASGMPLGGEFQANTYTPGFQGHPAVAIDGGGSFVVVWESGGYSGPSQDGSKSGIFGQRYDPAGLPLGDEFRVNTYTTDIQRAPSVAADAAGNFVVVWHSGYSDQDGSSAGIFARRYSSAGTPTGPEFQVNTYTTSYQLYPAVAADDVGRFVVVWQSDTQDGAGNAVVGQRFDASGAKVGSEFVVNTYTTGSQEQPSVALDVAGNFVVVWETYDYPSPDGDATGVFGQHFTRTGELLGPEFQVNTFATGFQDAPDVARAGASDFVVTWQSAAYATPQDGSGSGVFARRFLTTNTVAPARVPGSRLLLRDNAAKPTRKLLAFRANDPTLDLGDGVGSIDDPTLTGARLRIRSATFDDTYELPASRWRRFSRRGNNRGFWYRDRGLALGPIHSVRLRRGKLWLVGKGTHLGHVIGSTNPDPVTISLQTGTSGKQYCMRFGGMTTFAPGKSFKASGAPAPRFCPL